MWQRIQTVFLVITIIALGVSLVQPIWQTQSGEDTLVLTPFYLVKNEAYLYFPYAVTAMLAVAAITLSIIEIRRFDNRLLQMKLGALNTLLLAGMMISAIVFCHQLSEQYPAFSYGMGIYLIFAAVICNWIALRFIRRDEKLVRDSERLR
jgi:DMSO reductase anchor subunit